VLIAGMLKKIRDFKGVKQLVLRGVDKGKTSWTVPMVSVNRVSTVCLPRMIDLPQDFVGTLHPQDQLSWFLYGGAQVRRLDDHRIGRQKILNCRRTLILGRETSHKQTG
jgi:hypothetical protein